MDRVFYYHIPRTGGRGISDALVNHYGQENCYNVLGEGLWWLLKEDQLKPIGEMDAKFVSGHYKYGAHTALDWEDVKLITMLRDPVERVLSNYWWDQEYTLRTMGKYGDYITLEEFIESSAWSHNPVFYMLSLNDVPSTLPVEKETVEDVKRRLREDFFFVGRTEDIEGSLRKLGEMLGWTRGACDRAVAVLSQGKHTYKGVARGWNNEATPEVREMIAERNKLDYEIYGGTYG